MSSARGKKGGAFLCTLARTRVDLSILRTLTFLFAPTYRFNRSVGFAALTAFLIGANSLFQDSRDPEKVARRWQMS